MARRAPPEPRSRVRELITVVVAFVIALGLGRTIVDAIHTSSTLIGIIIFGVCYVVFYLLVYRLVNRVWPR